MQITQNLPIGLKHSRLVIGNGVLLAVCSDDLLRFSQFVPGHGREQVVLYLVIQRAIPEVSQGMGPDIAGGKYLLTQEVYGAVPVQNEHALVVGGSD